MAAALPTTVLAVTAALALAAPARARADNQLTGPSGIGAMVGGGIVGFVDEESRGFVSTGGAWEARLSVDPHATFSVEGAYIGSLQSIDALGLDQDARLLGNGAELGLKVNFLPGLVQPYALVGAGWTRYDLTNTAPTADLADYDNVLTVPLAIGFSVWFGSLVLDTRATYRATMGSDLFAPREDNASLDTWRMSLQLGFAM